MNFLISSSFKAKSGKDTSDVVYCHEGKREASNWKGGASYFTVMGAIPLYYWPDNHGACALYATVKHRLQRILGYADYCTEIAQSPNWNKLRLNITGLLKEPRSFWLFAKNQVLAIKDVGLFIQGSTVKLYCDH